MDDIIPPWLNGISDLGLGRIKFDAMCYFYVKKKNTGKKYDFQENPDKFIFTSVWQPRIVWGSWGKSVISLCGMG